MSQKKGQLFEFGPFHLDPQERVLSRNGEAIPLAPKTLDLLVLLVENRGHLLEKEELMKQLWPESFVEEANLSHHVFTLRRALADGENSAHYIETVPKRGYRFVGKASDGNGNSGAGSNSLSLALALGSKQRQPVGEVVADSAVSAPALGKGSKAVGARKVVVALLGLAALVAVIIVKYGPNRSARIGLDGVQSIAVLPFSLIGSETSDEYVGLAIADALITRLGNLDRLIVRPTSAILKYQGTRPDFASAGREMRVDAVLAGGVQRSGDSIRLTVQLIRTSDSRPLWTGKFDENATDLFALEDSISEAVARSLLVEMTGEHQKPLTRRHTDDLETYKLYVKGLYFADRLDFKKAREHFEEAIQRDANYAPAYLGVAGTYYQSELPGKVRRAKIDEMVSRALQIDEALAEGHLALATNKIFFDWDWPGAEKELQRSVRLKPNYAWAHLIYARYWQALGRLDKATAEIRQAQDLDPVSFKYLQSGSQISYCSRDFHQAIKQSLMALDIEPASVVTHELLALSYELGGMYDKAMEAWQRFLTLSGDARLLESVNDTFSRQGYRPARQLMLRERVRQLTERSKRQFVHPVELAFVYSALGNKKQTLKWLEKGYEEKDWALFEINTRPEFEPLRSEPRFLALLRKMGLPTEVVLP